MSDAANNPWISKRATAIITAPPVAVRARREVSLQAGVVLPEAIDRLEVRDVAPGRSVWWVGAHGGAGESTLAALGGQDAHHCWPRPTDGSIARVALVARTNYQGLTRLMAALRQYAAGELPFVHLEAAVLNADQPGRLPKELRDLRRHATGAAPDVWPIPYVPEWRLGAVTGRNQPRELRLLLEHLTQGENP